MAEQTQILEALNTKEAAVSTGDLAAELKSSTEGTRKQLARLKDKGYIEGDSKEGWLITDIGRKILEEGGVRVSMEDEGVTPRQKFEAIARQIGIAENRISLAADIVWSGDYTDLKWVWDALGQADIRDDLRKIWVNSWRAFLKKGIPPELEVELTGELSPGAGEDETGKGVRTKAPSRDYIILDEQPVRVGAGLGDYTMQDAKDILSIRALRSRFGGAGQPGAGQPGGTAEKVSEVLTALEPYINKGSDLDSLKEILADKLALQRQDILSHIPQPGQPAQPKPIIEQITDFVGAIGSLKEAGPTLRSILGIPEPSSNPPTTPFPVSVKGPDGNPIVMDLGTVIDWRKFQSEEKRADERHGALIGMAQTVRENVGTFAEAAKEAVTEAREHKGQTPKQEQQEQPHMFTCGNCGKPFAIRPEDWQKLVSGQLPGLPCPHCQSEYTREQLMA